MIKNYSKSKAYNLKKILFIFIYSFLAALGLCCCAQAFSSCGEQGCYSSLRCACFSLWWLLLLRSTGSRHAGFSSCGMRAHQLWLTGSRAQAQQWWRTGLVAPWHMGSSWTRDRTRVPCIGRWILNHCTTREVPKPIIFIIQLVMREGSQKSIMKRCIFVLVENQKKLVNLKCRENAFNSAVFELPYVLN